MIRKLNIAVLVFILAMATYGLMTRGDTTWRSGVPYLALMLASMARLKQEIGSDNN